MQRVLPPTLFVILGAGSAATGWLLPLGGPAHLVLRLAGVPVAIGGLMLTVGAARVFAAVGTNIKTFDDPGVLVTSGPFRWSRNPMYLGFTLALVGIAMAVGTVSAFLAPLLFLVVADRWYIPFEERRALATFGARFDAYRRSVRRWLGRRREIVV